MAEPLPVIFSFHTNELPPAERFSTWVEINAPTHTVRHPEPAPDPSTFALDALICTFGDLVISHGHLSEQVFARSPRHIRRDHVDHFGLFAQGEGTRTFAFGPGGTEQTATSGDLIFYDMHQPGESLASDGTCGTIYLPRPLVEALIPAASDHHGTILRGPIARLVAEHIHVVGGHMMREVLAAAPEGGDAASAIAGPGYHRLVGSTRDLALSCLLDTFAATTIPDASGHAAAATAIATRDDALRGAIVRHIDAHLGDPDLDIATLCAAFALSRSSLYRLFAEPGDEGIARLIKRRRLARVRAIILANQDRRPLAEIAADHGFRSAAHFSREFRAAYGYPPGELRQRDGAHPLGFAKRAPSLDTLFYSLAVA